jgi:glutathione S-transferase
LRSNRRRLRAPFSFCARAGAIAAMKLYIATPSPFARKARIALLEKGIPFEAVVENPWQPDTGMGRVNPLGKVPALVLDDGTVVHDSSVIVEYLETLGRPPRLVPEDPRLRVAHRQVEAIADGVCDAVVLIVLERAREPGRRSADWIARQTRKVAAGIAELERLLDGRDAFTLSGFGLAEIATGCALRYLDLRLPDQPWRPAAPGLARLFVALSARPAFAATAPSAQPIPAG